MTQPADIPTSLANSPRLIELDSRYSESLMGESFSETKTSAQVNILVPPHGPTAFSAQPFGMAKAKLKPIPPSRERRFRPALIKKWRKYRKKMTQEELAGKANMSTGNLSNIENGIQPYTQENLEAFAKALECSVVDLLLRDPTEDHSIWTVLARADDIEKDHILKLAVAIISDRK